MVFKMALYLVLEKKKHIFTFYRYIFGGCMNDENEFQEMIIFNELG